MPAFPFIPRIPFYRPYYRNYSSHNVNQYDSNQIPLTTTYKSKILYNSKHQDYPCHDKNATENLISKTNQSSKENNNRVLFNDNDFIFDLFGIKLQFDDILLICLIFFLYNEGVKDELLFISLILLLVS